MKRTERFGRPGLKKRAPRPAAWEFDFAKIKSNDDELRRVNAAYDRAFLKADPTPSRWSVRLRSLGGWLMSSRFAFLRSLGARWLRTGAFF